MILLISIPRKKCFLGKAYRLQHYYKMKSFTGIFQGYCLTYFKKHTSAAVSEEGSKSTYSPVIMFNPFLKRYDK